MPDLDLTRFSDAPAPIVPDTRIAPGVALVFSPDAAMRCTARRSHWSDPGAGGCPTLLISGENRAAEDWFGVEITLPLDTRTVALTCRNYPVHRLFPRLHFDAHGRVEHLDLAHVAAHDRFATRRFDAAEWREQPAFRDSAPTALRLTILVPSSPWFAMEIARIQIDEAAPDA